MTDLIKERAKAKRLNSPISDLTLAYIAGFVDGEGTLTIMRTPEISGGKRNHRRAGHRPTVCIANTNIEILTWIIQTLGVGVVQKSKQRGANRKQVWKYVVTSQPAIDIARILLPYLRIKRMQAEILLGYGETIQKTYDSYRTPTRTIVTREELTNAVRVLNRRGTDKEESLCQTH